MLYDSLRDFWELESLGIVDMPEKSVVSPSFVPSILFSGNRYSVSLPWKDDHGEVPNHLTLCESRLRGLLNRLRTTPDLLFEYDKIIRDQLECGVVEVVEPHQPGIFKNVHYLPHHGVVRQSSETTKLRIIYNGSARAFNNESSLNDCLETDPNHIPKLFDILVRFRWNRIAITADIEKAFLMIAVDKGDRDFLRFLWAKGPLKSAYELVHLRFTRLVFGLRPSPAILGEVLVHHIDKYQLEFPELTKQLKSSFYVDDLVAGVSDLDDAVEFCKKVREVMAAGSMNLRKWKSNSPELMKQIERLITLSEDRGRLCPFKPTIEEEDESYAGTVMGHCVPTADQPSRILGVIWDHVTDSFKFDLTHLESYVHLESVTKRVILRLTTKIFDPLGLVSPFVIQLKILFQKINWNGTHSYPASCS